jgi:small nuclear ribonucleoprotein E
MNLVIDDAVEVHMKKDNRRQLGRILLKGENVMLISQAEV